ncbi:hypothetical protein P9112_005230 [Eukaryota sp. TZLM1-RC]
MDLFSDEKDSLRPSFLHSPNDYPMSHLPSSVSSDRSERIEGVWCISSCQSYSLLLTYSGDVYGWGSNKDGQVLYNASKMINLPIKLPLNNICSISAGAGHSLALSSDGRLYGWGFDWFRSIISPSRESLPITPINIPFNIKEVYCGSRCSFALTQEGQVIKWGDGKSFEIIEGLNSIVFLSLCGDSFVAIDQHHDFFYFDGVSCAINQSFEFGSIFKIQVSQYLSLNELSLTCFIFNHNCLFIIDVNGDVWKFDKGNGDVFFNNKPTKIPVLNNIVSISGSRFIRVVVDNNGKVFVWGRLGMLRNFCNSEQPIPIDAFTNIEGISVGHDFLFAYNKNTFWAWGRNDKGQLGTGDLIDRPQPVKVSFGSEILGSLHFSKQPLDRMFSGLIKLIYFEYLQYLKKLFGSHPYTKARFYTKCSISKKVAKLAKEVICGFKFLKNPQDLDDNICDLQLRLSTVFKAPKVFYTRIKILDVYFDRVDYDPQLLAFFPNVEVVKLGCSCTSGNFALNLTHLSNLKYLELDYGFDIELLPTSLVKLVLTEPDIKVCDLSYLISLHELVLSYGSAERILGGDILLPQSVVRLTLLESDEFLDIAVELPNLKEWVIHYDLPNNITEQNFPSLKFVQLTKPHIGSMFDTPISLSKLFNQDSVKSVQSINGDYLVELSCFPWWIRYPTDCQVIY